MSTRRDKARAAIGTIARALDGERPPVMFVGGVATALFPLPSAVAAARLHGKPRPRGRADRTLEPARPPLRHRARRHRGRHRRPFRARYARRHRSLHRRRPATSRVTLSTRSAPTKCSRGSLRSGNPEPATVPPQSDLQFPPLTLVGKIGVLLGRVRRRCHSMANALLGAKRVPIVCQEPEGAVTALSLSVSDARACSKLPLTRSPEGPFAETLQVSRTMLKNSDELGVLRARIRGRRGGVAPNRARRRRRRGARCSRLLTPPAVRRGSPSKRATVHP